MTRKIALWVLAALVPVALLASNPEVLRNETDTDQSTPVDRIDRPTHPSDGLWSQSLEEYFHRIPFRPSQTRAWEDSPNLGPRFVLCNRPREMHCLECEYFDR